MTKNHDLFDKYLSLHFENREDSLWDKREDDASEIDFETEVKEVVADKSKQTTPDFQSTSHDWYKSYIEQHPLLEYEIDRTEALRFATRRLFLEAAFPTHADVVHFLEVLSGEISAGMFNTPNNYTRLMCDILAQGARTHDKKFIELLSSYTHLTTSDLKRAAVPGLVEAMKAEQICAGLTIAEIGGHFTACASRLGASVTTVDAGRENRQIVFSDKIVSRDNFQNFFPESYDIVCTNNVFDTGSGILRAMQNGGANPIELLIIEHLLVKTGGLILNYDSTEQSGSLALEPQLIPKIMQIALPADGGYRGFGRRTELIKFLEHYPKKLFTVPQDILEEARLEVRQIMA